MDLLARSFDLARPGVAPPLYRWKVASDSTLLTDYMRPHTVYLQIQGSSEELRTRQGEDHDALSLTTCYLDDVNVTWMTSVAGNSCSRGPV